MISSYNKVIVTRRLEGDGMDNEDLKTSQELPRPSAVSPASLPKRHHNLVTTLKATHVDKETSPKFIPHEPVRGAVKPVDQPSSYQPEKQIKSESTIIPVMPAKQFSHKQTISKPSHEMPADEKKLINEKTKERVLQTKAQLIDAPVKTPPKISIDITEDQMQPIPPEEEREVEGQSSSRSETEKLQEQVASLKDHLEVQIKVNSDLKKLLVASVGDDLHHKVESLVRTKAHLATEIGGYTSKITEDYEHLDNLAIEADKWQSKYMASKMLLENITSERDAVIGQLGMARSALRELLQERNCVRDSLLQTHRYLKLVRDSFDPQASRKPSLPVKDCIELALTNQQLGEAVKFRLLGSMPMIAAALDYGIQDGLTPAETNAFQVIAKGDACAKFRESLGSAKQRYDRFHPKVRYDNITFNCCRKCKGEIHVA